MNFADMTFKCLGMYLFNWQGVLSCGSYFAVES